jgi:hypothetical protein
MPEIRNFMTSFANTAYTAYQALVSQQRCRKGKGQPYKQEEDEWQIASLTIPLFP